MKKSKPEISIVIPTLNEEKYLPKLLSSISNQTVKNYEVIVADAGSKDSTVKLAKEWGAKVVKGGKPGPGRNAGAKHALGENIFFLDADVILPADFLEKAMEEITRKGMGCATWGVYASDGDVSHKLLFEVLSKAQRVSISLGIPLAAGFALFCTKKAFNDIGGFDEELYLAEDHKFVENASKVCKFGFLTGAMAGVSARRWKKEGGLKLAIKYIYSTIYMAMFGEIKDEIMDYEFGSYGDLEKKKFTERMQIFMKDLTNVEKIRGSLAQAQEKNSLALKKFQESLKKMLPKNWSK